MYNYKEYEDFWNNSSSDYKMLLEPYLVSIFKKYQQNSILEIGFGSGHLAYILNEIGFSGSYLGVDLNPKAVQFANQKLSKLAFSFETFVDYNRFRETSYDLAIFCLSTCEMPDSVITSYLQHIKAKKILIINPSTITNYFESKITKPFINKITSRFGNKPKWNLIAKIPEFHEQKRLYPINKNSEIPASMYYRSTGDILNLATQAGYIFDKYKDLKYRENTLKIAPVSKFEILWFKS
jgi:SAM-dependent methyltransferase